MNSRIILILDESTSMRGKKQKMINSINNMINQQRQVDPLRNHEIQFTVVKFNDKVSDPVSKSLNHFQFTQQDYNPDGCTALYDAIGHTLVHFRNEYSVIVVIVTDGQDNMSKTYKKYSQIEEMVNYLKTNNNWKFLYLCENPDQFYRGNSLGFGAFLDPKPVTKGVATKGVVTKDGCNLVNPSINSAIDDVQSLIASFRTLRT